MTTPPTTVPVSEEIQQASAWVRDLRASMGEVIVGQEGLVHSLFLSLLTGGRSPVKLCPIGDDARQAIARGGAEAFAFLRAPALVG